MRARSSAQGLLLAALAWLGCAIGAVAAPTRIVSLDYCADQFVLAIADRAQIAAVSYGADKDDSYFRARASGLRRTRGSLEEVLALRPDLVVRDWGGGMNAAQTYARFGVPVLTLGESATFADARAQLLQAAHAMGQEARGAAMVAAFDKRLAALRSSAPASPPRVLYLTAGGATAGKGVLMDEVIAAAGARNAYEGENWNVLPLEQLVQLPPAIVARGFFTSDQTKESAWSPAHHSGWRQALARARVIDLPTAAISCSAWFQLDAAETLHRALVKK